MKKNYKRILVTGGTGFIGNNLVKRLVQQGNAVSVFDDNSRGNLKRVKDMDIENYFKGDIRKKEDLLKIKNKFDIVYHLAFINGTENFYKFPEKVIDVGIKGIINVIDILIKNKKNLLMMASSSEVYNLPKKIPTDENVEILIPDIFNPRFSYGGTKFISELITINYLRKNNSNFKIFRPHNVFGPDMGNEHVIPQLLKKVFFASTRKNSKACNIKIQGSGNETRAFCYIDDAVDQIIKIQKHGKTNSIFNVGQNKEKSIIDLIRDFEKILDLKIKITKSNLKFGSTKRRCPNMKKTYRLSGNKNSYANGLKETIHWYSREYK